VVWGTVGAVNERSPLAQNNFMQIEARGQIGSPQTNCLVFHQDPKKKTQLVQPAPRISYHVLCSPLKIQPLTFLVEKISTWEFAITHHNKCF
jgi:hypothetical protein